MANNDLTLKFADSQSESHKSDELHIRAIQNIGSQVNSVPLFCPLAGRHIIGKEAD